MNKELTELQKELDETKWRQSEIAREDLSGKYGYCLDCPYINIDTLICTLPHKDRIVLSSCAKAYIKSREERNKPVKTKRGRK